MKKSEAAALAKTYVSTGFDLGYSRAAAVIETLASVVPDECDKEFLSNVAGLLKKQAKSEKKDFFALVEFETEKDGLVVMKKK